MVFLGKKYWIEEMPVYPMLHQLMEKGKYRNLLLSISDDEDAIMNEILNFSSQIVENKDSIVL
jgi:hypothetical protein